MTYDAVMTRQGQLQAVTGLPEAIFSHLHTVFAVVVEYARCHYPLHDAVRRRALRALPHNRVFAATEDVLLFGLSYLQSNPLQAAHAASCGLTPPARLGKLPVRPDQALPAVLACHPRVLIRESSVRDGRKTAGYRAAKVAAR